MNKLKDLRKMNNMTQEQLAEILKVDRSAVANWEIGRNMPKADRLRKMAEVLNCKIDDLI